MSNPKTSFVIPVYNAAPYLPQLIESLQTQGDGNWEALFTDDGSSDASLSLLRSAAEKDGRIRVFEISHEGSSGARNKGLDNAKGDVIAFVDADDFVHPQLLEMVLPCFDDKTVDAVMYDFIPVEPGAVPPFEKFKTLPSSSVIYDTIRWALLPWKPTAHGVWRTFYRRRVIGDIRFYPGIKHQDLLFSYQVWGEVNKMVKLEAVLYAYVQTPDSVIRSGYSVDKIDANFTIMHELYSFYADRPEKQGLLKRRLFPARLREVWKQVDRAEASADGPMHAKVCECVAEAWSRRSIGFLGFSPRKWLRFMSDIRKGIRLSGERESWL